MYSSSLIFLGALLIRLSEILGKLFLEHEVSDVVCSDNSNYLIKISWDYEWSS